MSRLLIYFLEKPADRWIAGDHKIRRPIRRLLRGPDPVGGIKRVFVNLCAGLDLIRENYVANLPFSEIRPTDRVGVIGLGRQCLDGYNKPNKILAGVAVAAHPQEWPELFEEHPVAKYVVHSEWVKDMYQRHYGPRIVTWAVGIDTNQWLPAEHDRKSVDFLVYDKVLWDHDRVHRALVEPLLETFRKRGLTWEIIRYGAHRPEEYRAALARTRSMLFLCEHETQGLAYQEAMSCNVPILAWNVGQWLDPWRFRYSEGFVHATSVPFFDERCGLTFSTLDEFEGVLERFLDLTQRDTLRPRNYVLENLGLDVCARKYAALLREYAG